MHTVLQAAIQACALLRRYGWHFPELSKLIDTNVTYARAVRFMGAREKAADLDFSAVLDEEVEAAVKEAAVVSMGTEISEEDMAHVGSLCDQVVELSDYRGQLYEYLRNRMQARAPRAPHNAKRLVHVAHGATSWLSACNCLCTTCCVHAGATFACIIRFDCLKP